MTPSTDTAHRISRRLSAILAIGLVTVAIAACQSSASPSAPDGGESAPAESAPASAPASESPAS